MSHDYDQVRDEELEALFNDWHDCPYCAECDVEVYEYMGLTWDQYKEWVARPRHA